MEFQENGTGVKDAPAKELNNKAHHNGEAGKQHANGKTEATKAKAISAKDEKPEIKTPEPAKTEPVKTEEAKPENVPSGIGLERTLKTVHALYRESVKRDNLIGRIEELEKFEIQLMEESDELEANHFQGCKLAIYDSKGRTFITNTSNLIKMVAEYVKTACYKKLAEIESGIVLPKN